MEYPKVRGRRCELRITQEEAAKVLGMATKTYNFKENGKNDFTLEEAQKLIKLLDCKFEDIFLK